MFMVREMYRHAKLSKWKVVFVTDRTQLEEQLTETSQSIGFTVEVADSIKRLKELLRSDTSDLVMAMIHKFREADMKETFPELNDSPLHFGDDRRGAPIAIQDAGRESRQRDPERGQDRLHRNADRQDRASLRRVHRQVHDATSRSRTA